jgi:hypothetical protein
METVSKCPSTDEWIKEITLTHTVKLFSPKKINHAFCKTNDESVG